MDGKLFLYNNATPPPISQVATTTFVFDLQRFAGVYDPSWNASTELASGESIGSAEIAGYDSSVTSGNTHKIKVENAGVTKYFDYMQSAMNFVLGNGLSSTMTTNNSTLNTAIIGALGNYDSDGAVVTLLDDITDGYGFVVGRTQGKGTIIYVNDGSTTVSISGAPAVSNGGDYVRNSVYLPTNVKIDLNGKQYLSAHDLDPQSVSNMKTKKVIQVSGNRELAVNNTSVSIVGGTLGVATSADVALESYMRTYSNVTLFDVYLDGTGVNSQKENIGGALVTHTNGTLNIVGNTSIVTKGSNYYAVAENDAVTNEKSDNDVATFHETSGTININTTGYVGAVGFYEWGKYHSNSSSIASHLNIQKGEIDKLIVSSIAVADNAFNRITVGSGATINTFEIPKDTSPTKLVYGSSSSTLEYSETGSTNYGKGQLKVYGIEGWNKDPDTEDKFNYAAKASDYSAQNGKGKMLIGVTGATSTDDLAYSSADSIFAIPSAASGEWGWELNAENPGYYLAKVDYNSNKDAVTISSADNNATISANTGGVLYSKVRTIDASTAGNVALAITGNSLNNTIYGNAGNDNISLNGGKNLFVFGGGEDVIKDYKIGNDTVGVANADFVPDGNSFKADSKNLIIAFSNANSITINGQGTVTSSYMPTHGVRVRNIDTKKDYIFTNYSVADVTNDDSNGITLGAEAGNSFVARNPFKVIDGTAASQAMSLTAYTGTNTNIIGGESATLIGSTGNDTLEGEQGDNYFVYTAGNDVISSYSLEGGDRVSLTPDNITGAKVSRDRLTFTVNKNTLTFNPVNDEVVGRVSLSTEGYLTKDGYVSADSNANFKLFAGTKGKIDFKEDTIYSGDKITSINAKESKNSVTLTADSAVKSVELASNKKKDLFEYDGGTVTISGYEAGKDRINIVNEAPIHAFAVDNISGDVAISVTSGTENVISLKGAATKEVLIHDADSKGNTYSRYIFAKSGVLYNKAKNPTEANLYSNAGNFTDAPSSIKKIFALGGVSGISIQSADNKATLDASEANSVSLVGGTKNNKFIGSNYADTFVYNGGKDVITNFQVGNVDALSIADTEKFSIGSAKITVSKKSLKFKFDSKNTLTLKSDSTVDSLKFGNDTYTFSKNAVSDGEGNVTLTSQFSGTYKIGKDDAGVIKSVDGSAVKKNLTFKGSDQGETLIGGNTSGRKTTFKGGGAAIGQVDSLVGGAGKDIFFYAKGDTGTTNIDNFDFGTGKDKLKIANGTIGRISSISGGSVQFAMTSGKKNDDTEIATFNVNTSNATGRIAIKANNTYYWFADEATANTTDGLSSNQLYTWDRKVTARDVAACDIIDLGYSTNLVKSKVAVKVATPTTNSSSSNNQSVET